MSLAMGAFFYKSVQDSKKNQQLSESTLSPLLPPGGKITVIVRNDRAVAERRAQPAHATHAAAAPPAPIKDPFADLVKPTPPAPSGYMEASPSPAATAVETPAPSPSAVTADAATLAPLPRAPWPAFYAGMAHTQKMKLSPLADTCIMAAPAAAQAANGGGAPVLPIKGNDSFLFARYDMAPVRGWTVFRASWHGLVKQGRARELGFSTIMADWQEGSGRREERAAAGATWLWADAGRVPWNMEKAPAGWFFRGNGQSLMCTALPDKTANQSNDWVVYELDPQLVQALIAGAASGLAISDEQGQLGREIAFASRESVPDGTYLEIEGELTDIAPPGAVKDLQAATHPSLARLNSVGAVLTWTATGDDGHEGHTFRYDIRYGSGDARFETATVLPQCLTPWPQPAGQPDRVIIEGLEPNTSYRFFVTAVDEAGQAGPVSQAALKTGPLLNRPVAPQPPAPFDGGSIQIAGNSVTLRVLDEFKVVNPLNGTIVDRPGAVTAPVGSDSDGWDRASRTIHLRAYPNETVGFQVALGRAEKPFPALTVAPVRLANAKGELPGDGLRLFRAWYGAAELQPGAKVPLPDGLLPLDEPVMVPHAANKLVNQAWQALYAQLFILPGTAPGVYLGKLVFTAGSARDEVNVRLTVLDGILPPPLNFNLELVAPATLAQAYKRDVANTSDAFPIEERYFQMAAEHRGSLSLMPYNPNGQAYPPFAPPVTGKGGELAVAGWTDWDARLGHYLDGSALAGAARGNRPVPQVILPLFESWPIPFNEAYTCADDDLPAPPMGLPVYAGSATNITACLGADYWSAFKAAAGTFGDHFHDRGWRQTTAQIWLRNGPLADYKGRAPVWSLGEPRFRGDFVALENYAGAANPAGVWPTGQFQFRASVPDAMWLADYGARRFSLLAVGDLNPYAWQALRRRAALNGETLWFQSETVPQGETPAVIESLAVHFFLEGAAGWSIADTIGRPENWMQLRPGGLFYCGAPFGKDAPFPSVRLSALRRAQQDIELLQLLADRMKWSRAQLAEYVRLLLAAQRGGGAAADDWHLLRWTVQELLAK